jgi:acyl-CoA thioester hydrolase
MSDPFSVTFRVGWAQTDANAHMRNTAFLDLCVDTRFMYFAQQGVAAEFERLRVGPVIFRDEVDYFRELRLLESVRVTLALCGLSEDGSRFRLRNELFAADGTLAARVTSNGAWLNLVTRKLTPPPESVAAVLAAAPHTDDFEVLVPRSSKA